MSSLTNKEVWLTAPASNYLANRIRKRQITESNDRGVMATWNHAAFSSVTPTLGCGLMIKEL